MTWGARLTNKEIAGKEPLRKLRMGVLWFFLHCLAAMPLAVLISVVLGGLLLGSFPARGVGNLLFLLLTFAIGCSLGFLGNRAAPGVVFCLVWLVGVTWLGVGIHGSVHNYDPRWYQGCTATENVVNAFFVADSSKCGGGSSTLNLAVFTLPALTSVAYSIGAYAGTQRSRRAQASNISASPGHSK